MTILGEELFIVSQSSSVVEVYHSTATEFTPSRQWTIGVADPGGIASCKNYQCIYIIGWKTPGSSRTILKVDPQGEPITEWRVKDSWSYLWVTVNSNVLLTFQEETKLIEYSPTGVLLHEIKLSSDACKLMSISNPWHSVKLDFGYFVVCCGLEDNDMHGVFTIDAAGKLWEVFGQNKDVDIARLNQPVHLVVDSEEFVFVADRKNSRVLLFDHNLKFQKEILFKENSELRFPSILYLDESRSFLYVVENDRDDENSKVLVFNLGP